MKNLWKQSGQVCVDAGPLSALGGRSRRRARLTVYGFAVAVAFAAFTAYVAFTSPPVGGAGGGGASWFGGVYASTAPYRSQISSFFSSILPANSYAPSPEPPARAAGGSSGGSGEVSHDVSSGQVGRAAGSNSSAAAGPVKQLGSGGGMPPASDFAGTGIGAKGGGGAPTNNSATSGGATNYPVDRNRGSDGGVSSSQARGVSSSQAGGAGGSPASSSAGEGTAAKAGEKSVDMSNKQSGSESGAPSYGITEHGSTAKAGAKVGAEARSSTSALSGSLMKTDLSTGSSSNQSGSGSGSGSAVPSSGSAAGNSTTAKADVKGVVGAASNSSAGSGTDAKADLNKGSDSQTGSGSGDAGRKSAGNSSPAKSNAGDGGVERNNGSVSVLPTINQAGSLAMAGEKEGGSPSKNHTLVASPTVNNQEQTTSGVASGGSGDTANKQNGATPQGSAGSSKDHSAQTIASKSGHNSKGNESSTKQDGGSSGNKKVDWFKEMASCDMFHGSWVRDDSYPLFPEGSCPHIDEPFDCYLNGRRDLAYQKLRWQPSGCIIPRLNPTDMLERLRGKRLVFVGDSLNRNMWESLVCILRNSVKDKRKVFEASGRHEFKTEGSYSFLFTDYNCSVEFFRSPFLVQEWEMQVSNGKKKETLRLDLVEQSSPKYKDADFLIFNTGHWWTHEKTALGKDYYQEGNHIYSELNVVDAFHKALDTWSKWIDANVNPRKTTVLFRGYSASHFSGGQWNSGGSCDKESEPITSEQYLSTYPPKMSILEDVIHKMKTPVVYLNITRMTDYRKDAHPSIFRKQNLTDEERRSPEKYQDCSHWCLPGVPDSWNELLYAQLLIKQHQMLQQ
ncbi:protein trichome birefringence-like 1 [Phragmites australis]|uniref:protein trichome birefringence-like 1 n=1 Tax=Phragmites australis TaxID=29695 RepID=UPI002D78705F|nr:protein trichome birefringence-like 1 [Phragmites australis]